MRVSASTASPFWEAPLRKSTYQYDESGNWIETQFFGTDGNPIAVPNGFARWAARYDSQGNGVENRLLWRRRVAGPE